jgi:hypothetical protein
MHLAGDFHDNNISKGGERKAVKGGDRQDLHHVVRPEPGQFAETCPGSAHIKLLCFERRPGGPPAGTPWNATGKVDGQQSARLSREGRMIGDLALSARRLRISV